MKHRRCIAFCGGGTAGHVFPALAVIRMLKKGWNGRIVWIGSMKGMERELVASENIPFFGIPSGKWRRYFSLRNITDLFKIGVGIICAVWVILREKPCLLFSKGGYVSVPPVLAARFLSVPVWTHESDFDPGMATRINALFAEKILISFRETERFFPLSCRDRVFFTGNPVRKELIYGSARRGRKLVGCPESTKMLLVLGGSQGASRINSLIDSIIEELTDRYFVIHQIGNQEHNPSLRERYYTTPFLKEELADVLKAANLVVSRAGANTLTELSIVGKAAVLIPLSLSGSRGDQYRNSDFFVSQGAAQIFKENEGDGEKLLEIITDLLDNDSKRKAMASKIKNLAVPNAAEVISQQIVERIHQ